MRFLLQLDDVSADEDVVFVPGQSLKIDENEDSLGRSYQEETEGDINSAETSDSEGVVVSSSAGASAVAAAKVIFHVGSPLIP